MNRHILLLCIPLYTAYPLFSAFEFSKQPHIQLSFYHDHTQIDALVEQALRGEKETYETVMLSYATTMQHIVIPALQKKLTPFSKLQAVKQELHFLLSFDAQMNNIQAQQQFKHESYQTYQKSIKSFITETNQFILSLSKLNISWKNIEDDLLKHLSMLQGIVETCLTSQQSEKDYSTQLDKLQDLIMKVPLFSTLAQDDSILKIRQKYDLHPTFAQAIPFAISTFIVRIFIYLYPFIIHELAEQESSLRFKTIKETADNNDLNKENTDNTISSLLPITFKSTQKDENLFQAVSQFTDQTLSAAPDLFTLYMKACAHQLSTIQQKLPATKSCSLLGDQIDYFVSAIEKIPDHHSLTSYTSACLFLHKALYSFAHSTENSMTIAKNPIFHEMYQNMEQINRFATHHDLQIQQEFWSPILQELQKKLQSSHTLLTANKQEIPVTLVAGPYGAYQAIITSWQSITTHLKDTLTNQFTEQQTQPEIPLELVLQILIAHTMYWDIYFLPYLIEIANKKNPSENALDDLSDEENSTMKKSEEEEKSELKEDKPVPVSKESNIFTVNRVSRTLPKEQAKEETLSSWGKQWKTFEKGFGL